MSALVRCVSLCLLCLVAPSLAEAVERLAVLELSGDLALKERAFLTDAIRSEVVKTLPDHIQVMTRENMEVMLTDMGLDASCVAEGACEVETARNLGVEQVVSGSILSLGGTIVLSVKLHNTGSGRLVAAEEARGSDLLGLRDQLADPTRALLASLVSGSSNVKQPSAGGSTANVPKPEKDEDPDYQWPALTEGQHSETVGELICLSPGSFPMHHQEKLDVTLTQGFCMMKHEVTQAQWKTIGWPDKSKHKKCDTCPAEMISWYQAVEYANWLSDKEGLTAAYKGSGKSIGRVPGANGYRLPTAAEFEAAALDAGRWDRTPSSWDDVAPVAWYQKNSGLTTHDVCTRQANGYGFCDLLGNVSEWVWNWDAYGMTGPSGPRLRNAVTDPTGPASGSERIRRGGNYKTRGDVIAPVPDWNTAPADRREYIGFRLVRSLQ